MKTKEYYEARINLRSGRGKENGRIIKKLERRLHKIQEDSENKSDE